MKRNSSQVRRREPEIKGKGEAFYPGRNLTINAIPIEVKWGRIADVVDAAVEGYTAAR